MITSHVSHRVTRNEQAPEVTDKGQSPPLNPNPCMREHSPAHWTRGLTSMAMLRAARKRARLVHISDIFPMSITVAAEDSKAAAVLSNLVSRCGEERSTPVSTISNKSEAPHPENCRRSSRLLEFFRSQNYTASGPHIDHKLNI